MSRSQPSQVGHRPLCLLESNFPLGIPREYAAAVGLTSFREGLEQFGVSPGWEKFFDVTNSPGPRQPFGPDSFKKGGLTRSALAQAIGLSYELDLFRRCDQKTQRRQRAEAIFYTTFARQVGRAVCLAWPQLLRRSGTRIWPFDGTLEELLSAPGEVLVEIYPAETVGQLGLQIGPNTKRSKTRKSDRQELARAIQTHADANQVLLSDSVAATLTDGFDSDDAFDAFVGLVGMIRVLRGHEESEPPNDEAVHRLEGWMLGRGHVERVPEYKPVASIGRPAERRDSEPYSIARIVCGQNATMELAIPEEPGRGSVNVLCGLNNSGKSFLLDQVNRVLRGKPHNAAISVHPVPERPPDVLFLGKIPTPRVNTDDNR